MQQRHGTFFGEVQKAVALALYESGSDDREIADAIPTSVNNIIWWRKEAGLPAQGPVDPDPAAAAEEPLLKAVTSALPHLTQDHRLMSPEQAAVAHAAPVQPEGDAAIEIGTHMDAKVYVDLAELLTTRLLVQGNSGSGKTHLLRKLLEECTGTVQQIILDPEGDFESFGEAFGHTVIHAAAQPTGRLSAIAAKVRRHRGSVVLSMEGMEIEAQMEAVTAFLNALFDAPPEDWHPALVAVDEAHLFAPAGDNGEDKETRKASQVAMANLMCRGRKRGLAGIIATQRLSKLHKNVAAEASNLLIGRTFLDIDVGRAVELLGIAKQDGDRIRDLTRGQFLGLGPAIARRPLKIAVGGVITAGRGRAAQALAPLPTLRPEEMQGLLLQDDEESEAPRLRVVGG